MIHMTTGYSMETYGAKVALEKSKPFMLNAIHQLPDESLQIIDYGIADGGTALDFFAETLQAIRKKNAHPITFIGNDLPSNPHNDLALHLNTLKEKVDGLRIFISPVSFYEQLVAEGSSHLGFSATAMHWLSKTPANLTTHIHANSAEAKEREIFRQQALNDFEQLMIQRAHELKPGGHLVLVNLAEASDDRSLGKNHEDLSMFDYMKEIFEATLQENKLPSAILADTNFQNYYKRKEDFEEVLARESLASQFEIADHQVKHTACPYRARFDEDKDVEQFADGLMKTIRSWSRHTFLKAIKQHGCDPAVVDQFYDNLKASIAKAPEQFSMDYIHSFLHLKRK